MRYKGVKGKVWQAVSDGIKRRDGDVCYSCHRRGPDWKWDAGHYRPVALVGSNNRKAWDDRFIHRQCSYCNGVGQGMQIEYRKHLVKDYGEEVVAKYDKEVIAHKVDPVTNWQSIVDKFNSLKRKVVK